MPKGGEGEGKWYENMLFIRESHTRGIDNMPKGGEREEKWYENMPFIRKTSHLKNRQN